MNTSAPPTVYKSVMKEETVPVGAAPSIDESSQNAVLLPAVLVYKMSRSLGCVTDVWR